MKLLVKGDDKQLAPRPHRASIVQILYDVIEAIGGDATLDEIIDWIPAAVKDAKQVEALIDRQRLRDNLVTQQNAGYFLRVQPKGEEERWRLAPLSYYNARQEWNRKRREKAAKYGPSFPKRTFKPAIVWRHDWRITTGVGVIMFLIGFIAGGVHVG